MMMSFLTWRFPASREWTMAEVVSRPLREIIFNVESEVRTTYTYLPETKTGLMPLPKVMEVTKLGDDGLETSNIFRIPESNVDTYAYLPETKTPVADVSVPIEPTNTGEDGLETSKISNLFPVLSTTYTYRPETAIEAGDPGDILNEPRSKGEVGFEISKIPRE